MQHIGVTHTRVKSSVTHWSLVQHTGVTHTRVTSSVTHRTATFGTVRISYVNHTSGAVKVCRRVSTYTHTRVCICVGVTACVYTRTQER